MLKTKLFDVPKEKKQYFATKGFVLTMADSLMSSKKICSKVHEDDVGERNGLRLIF